MRKLKITGTGERICGRYPPYSLCSSTEANCKTLEKAHEICLKWAQKHGTSFSPPRYELIYLTHSPRRFDMTARVNLGAHQVSPKAELNVLGLWIDG